MLNLSIKLVCEFSDKNKNEMFRENFTKSSFFILYKCDHCMTTCVTHKGGNLRVEILRLRYDDPVEHMFSIVTNITST